ncbi:MAG: endolytic transglycosylase MltG [Bryobacterales bacterium]|nr:endolytic transglycosylase MltG [Bryobacterales bacterium]
MRRFVLTVCLALAFAAGIPWFLLNLPYAGFEGETFVEIPRGASARQMAGVLSAEKVVRHEWLFLAARLIESRRALQAGEYRFTKPASPREVLGRIARGDSFYHELTVPEGWNMFQIGAATEKLGLFSAADFLAAARDPALIRDLSPRAPSLEGYLFPDTYRLKRRTTPAELCRVMTARFRQAWGKLGGMDAHPVATLASLVEKETGIAEERPLVASVFRNRLRLGMKLDCDPTTIYAALLTGRYTGVIHRSDLESRHPYNTYRNAGLPPGPIANPGLAAIQAALRSAETGYLYFVARSDGSGGHTFSGSIKEHEAATERYRRAHRKADKKGKVRGIPRTKASGKRSAGRD